MRRLPILPTLFVIGAVAVMIALGIWQLQRAEWKDRMLAEIEATQSLAPVDLDQVLASGNVDGVAFRRATVTCGSGEQRPSLRAGRNLKGQTGYSYFIPCRPDGTGPARRLEINAGWSQQPDSAIRLIASGLVTGRVGTVEGAEPIILTADTALGPLQPSAPPSAEDIPNNHLMYAFQWFFFAVTALIIYLLALRRRRGPVAPAPPAS